MSVAINDPTSDPAAFDEAAATSSNHDVTPAGASSSADQTDDDAAQTDAWRRELGEASDPRDLLERIARSVSREDLLRNPTLAGIIGDQADRLERRRQAERDREAQERTEREAEEARLAELEAAADDDDLLTLGEHAKAQVLESRKQRAERKAQAERDAAAAALFQTHAKGGLDAYVDSLPPALKARVVAIGQAKGAEYSKLDYRQGLTAWMGDVVAASVEDAKAGWEKDLRAAIRKEVLGEIEASDDAGSLEFGSAGASVPGGLVTQSEWEANRHNASWRKANLERLNRSLVAGSFRNT